MKFSTRSLALTAVIAALYVALTVPLGELASSQTVNIRPAEALTLLPLLFVEAIPGVAIGCLLTNYLTGAVPADVLLGALITLAAAVLTRLAKKPLPGAVPPILLNALLLPVIWAVFAGSAEIYPIAAAKVLATQAVWVLGLGLPLLYTLKRLRVDERFLR